MKEKILIKAIDHCIEKLHDICSKCVYAQNFEADNYIACEHFEKDGNVACRNGIIKYFEENE